MLENQVRFIFIGGAEDKKSQKIILKKIVEHSNAKNIAIIPTASSYPVNLASDYVHAFTLLGVQNCEILDIRKKEDCQSTLFNEFIEKADVVFFTGGDQVKLVDTIKDTKLFNTIKKRNLNNELLIAGTSAGAASASDPMLYDGDFNGFSKDSVKSNQGFGWMQDYVFDTHFWERGRLPRLIQFLLAGKIKKGIGLSENTAVIVYSNNSVEVVGTGVTVFVDVTDVLTTNYNEIPTGASYSADNINISFLANQFKFDLNTWKSIKTDTSQNNVFLSENFNKKDFLKE